MATNTRKSKKPVRRRASRPVVSSYIVLHRILVPIDFSDHSKNALKYAVPFARQFGASLELLYVVEPAVYPADFSFGQVGFPEVEDEMRRRGTEELKSLAGKEIPSDIPVRTVVRTGKPFYEIEQHAGECSADIIIIATHGHSGIEHVLFGSTAEKVVRHAPCPVLIVRGGEREFVK